MSSMEPQKTLYKYRSLQSWKFVLDIFLNRRLFAAEYRTLNDPMEGRYLYTGDSLSNQFVDNVLHAKRKLKICSLSESRTNTLMWSHYSDGHAGIALGIRVKAPPKNKCQIVPVEYVDEITVEDSNAKSKKVAKQILSKKMKPWAYEKEVRLLTERQFIPIYIDELVLGCKIDANDEALLRQLVDRCSKRTEIIKLKRSDLDAPQHISAT